MATAIQRLRTDIVGLLKEYFDNEIDIKSSYNNIQIVPTDISYTSKPKYPFISYKINRLTNNSNNGALITRELVKSKDEGYKDIKETKVYQPKFTISFNSYSKDEEESQVLAEKLKEYFDFTGYYDLKYKDLIVTNIGTIQSRNLILNMAYEYRYGFDVEIRTITSVSRTIETIETFKVDKELK